MFEQTFVDGVGKTNKTWTVLLSFVGQIVVIGIVCVIIPMIYFDVLPKSTVDQLPGGAAAAASAAASSAGAPPVKVVKVIPRQFDAGKLMAPKTIPKEIAMIKEEELPPPPGVGGVVGGVPGGVPAERRAACLAASSDRFRRPLRRLRLRRRRWKPVTPQRIRVGGNVQQAKLIRQPKPVYPPLAKQARIQGVVQLSAIIGKDGTIQNLEVVSGHPLLVQAALEAVKQWVYQPTLLNGEPVEV